MSQQPAAYPPSMTHGMSELAFRLLEAMTQMPVIDCHEHLDGEDDSVCQPQDVFRLFSHWSYIGLDLERAGMQHAVYESLLDSAIPLDQRWDLLEPFWEQVRFTSYARCLRLTAEQLYGFSDINRETYQALSAAMRAASGQGLIRRVLREVCGIQRCVTDHGLTHATDLYAPLVRMDIRPDMETWDALTDLPGAPDSRSASLDDLLDGLRGYLRACRARGAVGLKMAALNYGEPDRAAALDLYESLRSGRVQRIAAPCQEFPYQFGRSNPLRDYIHDALITCAGELGMVVSAHTGYWGDFRNLTPLHLIPEIMRHPEVRYDVYHLGYPWLRETMMLAKGFSNVWLNLCWVHIISQRAAVEAVSEILDLLPANKILAFGGDFSTPAVECVAGHLAMAREDIARALAGQVALGRMNEDQAERIARRWFYENPAALYGIEPAPGAL